MSQFGVTLEDTPNGRLIRFPPGMQAGQALAEHTLRTMFLFRRDGGVVPTGDIMVDRQRQLQADRDYGVAGNYEVPKAWSRVVALEN